MSFHPPLSYKKNRRVCERETSTQLGVTAGQGGRQAGTGRQIDRGWRAGASGEDPTESDRQARTETERTGRRADRAQNHMERHERRCARSVCTARFCGCFVEHMLAGITDVHISQICMHVRAVAPRNAQRGGERPVAEAVVWQSGRAGTTMNGVSDISFSCSEQSRAVHSSAEQSTAEQLLRCCCLPKP